MADKAISDLPAASAVTSNDLFVLEQSGIAKKLTGATLEAWLLALADGHGGISSISLTGSTGTDPVVDTYTITYADTTTSTFTVTNGEKGDPGDSMYIYIRYASSQPTQDSDMSQSIDAWIGIYVGTEDDPTELSYTDYAWYQIKGATGDPGTAASVSSQEIVYQEHTSGTTAPTGTWSASPPSVTQGNYLWTRTTITFNTGNPVVFYSVSHAGQDGTGTGDMQASVYDPEGAVGNLPGGIPQYVGNQIPAYESATPLMDTASGSAGTNNSISRGNHSHPKDASKADLDSNTKVDPEQASSHLVSVTASKTLALTDAGTLQVVESSSAVTITIPASTNVEFPDETEIEIVRYGSGTVTITGDTGVTVNSVDGDTDIADQYGCVCLKMIDTDEWLLAGDLG